MTNLIKHNDHNWIPDDCTTWYDVLDQIQWNPDITNPFISPKVTAIMNNILQPGQYNLI